MSNGTASACPCGPPQDPRVVSNPPGLTQIAYRADDFTGFRRALLRPLPGEQAISTWRPAPGDLGLQALEWWAYLGDILTFYNERIANESYLGTATQQASVANLVALLGYEPGPGIAATGNVAVIRTTAHPAEPLAIPAGMPLSSVATPGVPAQTFEVATAASFTGVSSIPVTLAPDTSLNVNSDGTPKSVLLAGRVTGIKPNDQLVLVERGFTGTDDHWALVTVGAVTPATDPGTSATNTLVTFSAGDWGPVPPSASGVIRRLASEVPGIATTQPAALAARSVTDEAFLRMPVYYHWSPGMKSPSAPSPSSTSYRLLRPTATAALWNLSSDGTAQQPIVPGPPFQVHLSAAVRAITPGDTVLFEDGTGSPLALAVVAEVSEQFFAVPFPGSAVPAPIPLTDADIGSPAQAGSASYAGGVFTVKGSGADIWGTDDEFNYDWQPLAGDGSIVARVTSQGDTNPWAKSGVIIKQSIAGNSKYALLAVTPGNGIAFQYGYSHTVSGGNYSFPNAWLKLTRSGSTFTAYTSADGAAWTQVGSAPIDTDDPVTIGIFSCAHDNTQVCTATFDNVTIAPAGFSTPPDIAVAHTVLTLTLATADANALSAVTDPAAVVVRYAVKDAGTITGVPAAALGSLPAIVGVPNFWPVPNLAATAFLQDTTGAGVRVTVSAAGQDAAGQDQVTLTGAGTPPATITTPLAVPLHLLLDLVPVSRGTTVTGEVLGSGNAALTSQSFTLAKSPLTYLASGSEPAAALTVYVDGIAWQQVLSFYNQPADAQVYVVSRSPDQSVTTVTFGDGANGARLTSGSGNVTATYRYGSGAASPPAGRLTTISKPQPNLASIQNPVAVSGGADSQPPGDVRANAPASVFAFGRAISAVDYRVVALQAPGVSRVTTYWTFDTAEQRTLVTVYVGDDQAAVAAAAAALTGSEDPNRPVSVVSATGIELGLACTVLVAADRQVPAVVSAATGAVSDSAGGLFSPATMGIGQRLYRSAIEAALMVPGVLAVHQLTVTWAVPDLNYVRVLGEYFDPGEGSFFDLPPGNVVITGVSSSG